MTLALNGKSRRRQGSLLLAALIAVVVAMAAGVASLQLAANAAFVEPQIMDDRNPTCAEAAVEFGNGQTWQEVKFEGDDLAANTTVNGVTIKNFQVVGGVFQFDWESTVAIDAVIVKQGSQNHNVYVYDPPGPEKTSDTGLRVSSTTNGGTESVSHISFCYDPDPKLTVIKRVVNAQGQDVDDPTDFTFTVDRVEEPETGVSPTAFTLDDDQDSALSNTQAVTLPSVTSGSDWYKIDETNASSAGWELQAITCTGAAALDNTDLDDGNIEIKVTNASDVTCTFKNKIVPPPARTFQVCKQLDLYSNGVNNGGSFTVTISGQANLVATVNEATDTEDCTEIFTVPHGTQVTVNETAFPAPSTEWPSNAAGYPKYSATGVSTASLPASGVTFTVGNDTCAPAVAAQQQALVGETSSLVADIQQTVVQPDCVIVIKNKAGDAAPAPTGTVIVKKVVSGTAANVSDDFGGTVNGPTGQTFSDLSADTNKVYAGSATGSYTVSETTLNGYTRLGYAAGTWASNTASCPAQPTSAAATSASQDLAANGTIVFCVYNQKDIVPDPSVSVSKADSGDGTYDLGTSFYWTLTFSVSNPPTTADLVYTDNVPAQFTVTSLSDEVDPDGELSCSNVGNAVSCTLDDGAGTATNPTVYSIRVNVTVKGDATCGTVTNTVTDATGATVATDDVMVEGCGTVTIEKADSQVVVGNAVTWTITLSNDSAVAKNVIVYDPNTDLVATGTVGCVNNAVNDYYDCTVPANGTATLKVSQAIPAHDTCLPYDLTNTAYIAASNTAGSSGNLGSDSGKHTAAAVASASCITVTKTNTGNGTWDITFSNTGPQATVDMSDTYEPNGTNTNINSVGAPATGCSAFQALSVTGCDVVVPTGTNSVTITVETDPLGNRCEDQRVVNTVTATYNGTPVNGSGSNDDFSLEGTETLCTRQITIIKNFENLGGYVPVESDVPGFTLTPSTGTSCAAPVKVSDSQWTVACTVPALWDGQVSETLPLPAGWQQCAAERQTLLGSVQGLLRSIAQVVAIESFFEFCNEPFGTIRIEKVDGVNGDGSSVLWDFSVGGNFAAPGGGSYGNPAQASDATPFVSLPIGLSNTPVTVSEVLARSIDQCTQENSYYTIATPPADTVINTPGEVQTWTFQNIPCGTLGTGGLIIEKYEDINGNGIVDADDGPIAGWTFVTTGGGIPAPNQARQTDGAGEINEYIAGFDAGTMLTVNETQQNGWTLTRVFLDGAPIGTNLSNGVVIIGGEIRTIRYLNQQLGSINIHKAAETRHNGVTSAAPNDDDGWTFTLVSIDCGINFAGQTDASGNLSFTGLPMCDDYVVTEVGPNASSPGFVQVSPAGAYTGQTPDGQTLNFVNRKTTNDPPCQDCRQPTPTPTTPPVTPTATPATPTATPKTPTVAPTTPPAGSSPSITAVAGEKTPGPGGPTPIAPSAGGGLMGGATGGMNIILVLAGLLALAGGLGFLALERKGR